MPNVFFSLGRPPSHLPGTWGIILGWVLPPLLYPQYLWNADCWNMWMWNLAHINQTWVPHTCPDQLWCDSEISSHNFAIFFIETLVIICRKKVIWLRYLPVVCCICLSYGSLTMSGGSIAVVWPNSATKCTSIVHHDMSMLIWLPLQAQLMVGK